MALSTDGELAATAGSDGVVRLWDCRRDCLVEALKGHRAPVNCLAFGLNSKKLVSSGVDRTFRMWDCGERVHLDTFYGHRDEVTWIDAVGSDDFISCGYDQQVIYWRTAKEAQLIFEGHGGSIDCVQGLAQDSFVSGSMDGDIILWSTKRKKYRERRSAMHGGSWVSSLASQPGSNVLASGGSDGRLKFYLLAKTGLS